MAKVKLSMPCDQGAYSSYSTAAGCTYRESFAFASIYGQKHLLHESGASVDMHKFVKARTLA